MEWRRTSDDADADGHPMRSAASAAKLLAGMREADPITALNELTGWLEAAKGMPAQDKTVRGEVLSLIQEGSGAHVSALLAQFLARPTAKRGASESSWKALSSFLTALAEALYGSARALLKTAAADPSLKLAAAADAARCLHACRTLAKAWLIRYLSVPPGLWRLAYKVHDKAEQAGCATTPVRMHASHKAPTAATHELLRLLMLQSSAPEMMAPEQIEVADRVIDQLSQDFTLRPRGVSDNAFCFDSSSDRPPRRAPDPPQGPDSPLRYFGAGAGFDALERLYKQLATVRTAELRALGALGKDIAPHAQLAAIQHLLAFWSATCPYTPPARSPASGELRIIHGYSQLWQHLSSARSGATELMLAEDGDNAPSAPETWTLKDVGGNELGADIPQSSGGWARCGDIVVVSMNGNGENWLGAIRFMHVEPGGRRHAGIAIQSRDPEAVQLCPLMERGEENAYSEQAAREFAFNRVRAIILADGSEASQKPNFLLPPESWKPGAVFEATMNGAARHLRGMQLLRRGEDYVRATFEWVEHT
jgi:hypothetical protein